MEPLEHGRAIPPRFVLKQGGRNDSVQTRLVQSGVDRWIIHRKRIPGILDKHPAIPKIEFRSVAGERLETAG